MWQQRELRCRQWPGQWTRKWKVRVQQQPQGLCASEKELASQNGEREEKGTAVTIKPQGKASACKRACVGMKVWYGRRGVVTGERVEIRVWYHGSKHRERTSKGGPARAVSKIARTSLNGITAWTCTPTDTRRRWAEFERRNSRAPGRRRPRTYPIEKAEHPTSSLVWRCREAQRVLE